MRNSSINTYDYPTSEDLNDFIYFDKINLITVDSVPTLNFQNDLNLNNKLLQIQSKSARSSSSTSNSNTNEIFDLTSSNNQIRNETAMEDESEITQKEFSENRSKCKILSKNNEITCEARQSEVQKFDYKFDILFEEDNSTVINERCIINTDLKIKPEIENNEENKSEQIIHSDKEKESEKSKKNHLNCKLTEEKKKTLFIRAKLIKSNDEKISLPIVFKQQSKNPIEFTNSPRKIITKNSPDNFLKISEKILLGELENQIKKIRRHLFWTMKKIELQNNNTHNSNHKNCHKIISTKTTKANRTHSIQNSINSLHEKLPDQTKPTFSNYSSSMQNQYKIYPKFLFPNRINSNNNNNQIMQQENQNYHQRMETQNHNIYGAYSENNFYADSNPISTSNIHDFSHFTQSTKISQNNQEENFTVTKSLNKKLSNLDLDSGISNEEYDPSILLKIKVKVTKNESKQIILRKDDNIAEVIEDFCIKYEIDKRLKSPLVKNAMTALYGINNEGSVFCLNKNLEIQTNYAETNEVSACLNRKEIKSINYLS